MGKLWDLRSGLCGFWMWATEVRPLRVTNFPTSLPPLCFLTLHKTRASVESSSPMLRHCDTLNNPLLFQATLLSCFCWVFCHSVKRSNPHTHTHTHTLLPKLVLSTFLFSPNIPLLRTSSYFLSKFQRKVVQTSMAELPQHQDPSSSGIKEQGQHRGTEHDCKVLATFLARVWGRKGSLDLQRRHRPALKRDHQPDLPELWPCSCST